ncbi:MAG TPA: glycoside hydrolase family 44 protein, partial [Myxococcaceae bacterium]
TAANGGVRFVDLDNEPSGWANTHRDVVPDPPVYGSDAGVPGIIELGIRYATAVKQVDPTIQVLGPVDFGYPVYDRAPGYLDTFKAAEATAGQRLLDYLDEHYYPASCPANTTDPGTADDQAKRLRATRSLWDPTWKDESWIGQYYPPIQLIPFFRAMIAQHYPGTKLAITEYNFGGIASMNGALAQADVLGIFGREQVDLATMWGPPGTTDPVAYSFRMYRTYDGQGHGFGDVSVHAQSADQDAVSIYAAQRSSDGALTVMLVNKTTDVAAGTVALAGFSPAGPVQVWTYGPANLGAIQQQSGPSVSGGTIQVSIPAQTLMLLVLASTVVTPDAGVGTDGGVTDAGPGSSPGGSSTSLGDVVGSCAVGSGPAIAPGTLAVLLAWFLRRPRKR